MPDTSAPAPTASAFPDALLHDLLAVSLTGVNLLRPLYSPDNSTEVVDFAVEYLNPAAQRMTGLPEQPGGTMRTCFPETFRNGVFAFYQRVYQTGEAGRFDLNYQADGLNNYFHVAARRSGDVLVVSFTDTADQSRTPVEQALRDTQAAEQAARAAAETRRKELEGVFAQAPVGLVLFQGPEYRIDLANSMMGQIWGRPVAQVLGQPVFEAMPDLKQQGFEDILADVYYRGIPYSLWELPVTMARTHTGQPAQGFFNVIYQPHRDADGAIVAIVCLVIEVTDQVRARQQVEHLNQELEARVAERTRELANQQAFLQQIQSKVPAFLATFRGPNHVYSYFNEAYGRDLTQGRAEVGRPLIDCLPELMEQGFIAVIDGVYATGQPVTLVEARLELIDPLTQQARTRYVNVSYHLLRTEAGDPQGVMAFATDVTEQVGARHRLEESQEALKRFQFMADQARDPFILMREDGTFAYLNPKALDAWGYTAEEARHLRVPDVDPIYQDAVFNEAFAQAQRGTLPQFETLHRHKDGHTFPVEVNMGGLLLNGQPHLFAIARDITPQKRYVAALQESEARFRTMADAAPNLVWAVHPDSSIRYINRAFLDFVGLDSEEQYIATGWQPYLHPDELDLTQRTLTHAIAQRQPYVLEHRMRRHDGQFRWLLAQGAPSYLAGGELYGYVGSAIDITELKQTNEQLVRTNIDLDNFIYTASHDLKAPISNIEGLLHLLREELPPAVAAEPETIAPTLTRMLDSVERFKRTIDHLTEVSKLQKEHAPATASVNLAAVVEDVRQDLLPQLHAAGARLLVDVTALPPVHFSEKNLRSIVYNLLSNAVKFRHPDRTPHVDVRAHVRPGHTVLEVHDNGLGITADQLPRLFTMFQRFHDHVEGTGIGLYMVKRMVENAGGRIEVHSQLGAGSTFFVFLPHAPRPTA